MTTDDQREASLAEKFEGSLLGLALGDCLGASWEGYRGTEVAEAYYDGRFDPVNLRISEWTDDTAMAMATAQSIVDTSLLLTLVWWTGPTWPRNIWPGLSQVAEGLDGPPTTR